jgi:hypothetical protein
MLFFGSYTREHVKFEHSTSASGPHAFYNSERGASFLNHSPSTAGSQAPYPTTFSSPKLGLH